MTVSCLFVTALKTSLHSAPIYQRHPFSLSRVFLNSSMKKKEKKVILKPPEPPDPPDPPNSQDLLFQSLVSSLAPAIAKKDESTASRFTVFVVFRVSTASCRFWCWICSHIRPFVSAPMVASLPIAEQLYVESQAKSVVFGASLSLLDQISPSTYDLIYPWCLTFASNCAWVFDECLGIVLLKPSLSNLIIMKSADFSPQWFPILPHNEGFTSVYLVCLFDIVRILARPVSALCRLFSLVFEIIVRLYTDSKTSKLFSIPWLQLGVFPVIRVLLDTHGPLFSFKETVCLLFPPALCGFDVGSKLLKSLETSFSAQHKGSTTWFLTGSVVFADLAIVNCALVAISVVDYRSLYVFSIFQGFVSPSSTSDVEMLRLLHKFSRSRVPLTSIYPLFFICLANLLVMLTLLSCNVNNFSTFGE